MYYIEEKEEAIANVQRNLLIISQINENIPQVSVDGIYGEETRNAVKIYQISKGV